MSHSHEMPDSSGASSMMQMVFFTSSSTPLFSSSWTPKNTAAYAATCIFLIVLAFVFRLLVAGKHVLEHRWLDGELHRRYVAVQGLPLETERIISDSRNKDATLISERGVEEHVRIVRRSRRAVSPWRFSVDLPRAVYATVLAGIGYLLYVSPLRESQRHKLMTSLECWRS